MYLTSSENFAVIPVPSDLTTYLRVDRDMRAHLVSSEESVGFDDGVDLCRLSVDDGKLAGCVTLPAVLLIKQARLLLVVD